MKEPLNVHNLSRYTGAIRLVAENAGHKFGEVITSRVGRTTILESFYVNRSARKRGVGSQLLSETERLSREQGAKRIVRIGLFCDNNSLIEYLKTVRFLRKRGYTYWGIFLSKRLP